MKSIGVFSPRGGSGKTTVTLNLCAGLSRLGKKSLIIDFDPESHLTFALGKKLPKDYLSLYSFLNDETGFSEIIYQYENYDFIPSTFTLYYMNAGGTSNKVIKQIEYIFTMLECYDYVIIDCPPSFGYLNCSILNTVSYVITPLTIDSFVKQSANNIMLFIDDIFASKKNSHRFVVNRYNKYNIETAKYFKFITKKYSDKIFKTFIRDDGNLSHSLMDGNNIFNHDHTCSAAHDYLELSLEVIDSFK